MTTREKNLRLLATLTALGAMLGDQAKDLAEGADHPYSCTCDLCRRWWRLVGPDEDTGMYGPFGATIEREGGISHE